MEVAFDFEGVDFLESVSRFGPLGVNFSHVGDDVRVFGVENILKSS